MFVFPEYEWCLSFWALNSPFVLSSFSLEVRWVQEIKDQVTGRHAHAHFFQPLFSWFRPVVLCFVFFFPVCFLFASFAHKPSFLHICLFFFLFFAPVFVPGIVFL